MRVLIADDEKKVCELITHLINWDELGMEIIGYAHNGETAISMITSQKPDIVITDIRMPGLSGLEVIRMAKKVQPNIEFIVISGFKQFDYAKEALQYGVSNYLLKPINRKELNYTLTQIQNRDMAKKDKALEDKRKNDTHLKNKEHIRKDALYQLLTKQTTESIESLNTDYYFDFQPMIFQLAILKIDGIQKIQKHSKYFTSKLKYLSSNYMTNCIDFEFVSVEGKYIFILNFKAEEEASIRKNLKLILDGLQDQQDIFQGFSVSGSLGDSKADIIDAIHTLEQAKIRLNQRLIKDTNRIYFKDNEKTQELLTEKLFLLRNQFIGAVEIQSLLQIDNALREVYTTINNDKSLSGHTIVNFYKDTFEIYLLTLKKFNFYTPDLILSNFDLEIENFGCVSEIHTFFSQTVKCTFEMIIKRIEEKESKPILEAKVFIRENYADPISLEIVANKVGFSASYFSSMFKEQTGESFSEYLFRKRMEEAKNQLRSTRNSVAVICEDVGYTDIRNFTKGFKKFTGLNPKDYRKLYG